MMMTKQSGVEPFFFARSPAVCRPSIVEVDAGAICRIDPELMLCW